MSIKNLTTHHPYWGTSLYLSTKGCPKYPQIKKASTGLKASNKRHWTKVATVISSPTHQARHPALVIRDKGTACGSTRHSAWTWQQTLANNSSHLSISISPSLIPFIKFLTASHLKWSYSCISNIKTIISNHNKTLINKSARTNNKKKNSNCRKPHFCPMNGNCNAENVIYQAEVTTATTKETHLGICDTTFKLRYRNHVFISQWAV